jgi:hypothetical protein
MVYILPFVSYTFPNGGEFTVILTFSENLCLERDLASVLRECPLRLNEAQVVQ